MKKRELSTYGIKVKKRLIELNRTQRWLAEKVGTSEVYLNLILYGERSGAKYVGDIDNVLKLEKEGSLSQNQFKEVI